MHRVALSPMIQLALLIVSLFGLSCTSRQQKSQPAVSTIDSLKFPEPSGWVNDYAGLFSAEEEKSLDSIISNYEERTSVEIAVAVIDSARMGMLEMETYTKRLSQAWGVGKKDKNNGILIAIAPHLQKIRIHQGTGVESHLSKKETKEIIDYGFIPYFRKSGFYSGTKNGILAIIRHLDKKGYKG